MSGDFCSIAARPVLTAGMLRCDCGGKPFSVSPGSEPETAPGGFPVSRGEPARALCRACWVARFGVGRTSDAGAAD